MTVSSRSGHAMLYSLQLCLFLYGVCMQNTLLWVGAGDLAQRCMPYLDASSWHRIALRRQPTICTGFDKQLAMDMTQTAGLSPLPAASHVIYSITPSGRTPESYQAVYDTALKHLLQALDTQALQRFIFISSTSVYGPDPVPQDEFSILKPTTFSGQAIQAAETYLEQKLGDKLSIIRFSGLYGPGRQRIFDSLRAQTLSINPALTNYANRIHSEDAARVCAHLLHLEQPARCYVATDNTPLPLRQLYQHIAQRLAVPPPRFDTQLAFESKHFSNQRLLNSGFHFLYPNTLQGYDHLLESIAPPFHES